MEWFAIDYEGRFWSEKPGVYQFALTSDDGAKLYIDDELTLNNDGIHPSETKQRSLEISLQSPLSTKLVALSWKMVLPVQMVELIGDGPETERTVANSGKLVTCSLEKELFVFLFASRWSTADCQWAHRNYSFQDTARRAIHSNNAPH